jgi:hypothetical protein
VCGRMPVSMVQSWRLKKEDTQKLKTMIDGAHQRGNECFQGKERENHSLWGTHKKCECARCYPMRRRSSDQRYVAYSLTLKRDEKTLMNRHVMTEKQHNTTTISRPTMTKPFNVVNTKPALCFIIWEPTLSSQSKLCY